MHTTTAITMRAPKERIFETAADLSGWPRILPHYRYIHYYERGPERNVVKMACTRSGLPVARLVALTPRRPVADAFGVLRGEIALADDFDELPEDFVEHFR